MAQTGGCALGTAMGRIDSRTQRNQKDGSGGGYALGTAFTMVRATTLESVRESRPDAARTKVGEATEEERRRLPLARCPYWRRRCCSWPHTHPGPGENRAQRGENVSERTIGRTKAPSHGTKGQSHDDDDDACERVSAACAWLDAASSTRSRVSWTIPPIPQHVGFPRRSFHAQRVTVRCVSNPLCGA